MEKQMVVEQKQEASNKREMEELAERIKEMMMVRKTRRVRSETQVWEEVLVVQRAEGEKKKDLRLHLHISKQDGKLERCLLFS